MSKNLTCLNPFTQEIDQTYPYDTFAEASDKVNKAKNAFNEWSKESVEERVELVKKALNYFHTNREKVAIDITNQMGRPLTHSFNEIDGFFERADYLCKIAKETLTPDELPSKENFLRQIEHVPLGVVFTIAPWNYPLLTAINSIATALLCGNTVILKHSSLTPSIGFHLEKAFAQMGGYSNLIQNIIIDHPTTEKLIKNTPIDHVVFTGSVSAGHKIYQHVSTRFIGCGLELGGKDAAYIASDADIEYAADTIVDGAMYNAGQSCCGIERIYVHETIYDNFLSKVKSNIEKHILGDPMKSETTMGPLSSPHASQEMVKQIQDAVDKGAQVILGGKVKTIQKGTFFEPTLVVNVNHDMSIMQDENFGPILPIMKVKNDDEAVQLANDSDFGLTAAIFTKDVEKARYFASMTNAGTIFMNRCDYLDPALPWTGIKDSGLGSTLSKYGFYALTRRQAIHFKLKV